MALLITHEEYKDKQRKAFKKAVEVNPLVLELQKKLDLRLDFHPQVLAAQKVIPTL